MQLYWYGEHTSPGVTPIFNGQNTDAAAAEALKEQAPGSEFNPQTSPDLQALTDRLNDLEAEATRLQGVLWGPPGYHMTHNTPYKGPPWLEKERLQRQLDKVDQECYAIKAQMREIVDATGFNTETGSQFSGTAAKVILPDPNSGA